ncbi:hypothetical protein B7R22_02420 [Subtercola boreus]|uniref:HTH gntR-type domain-containing protein n=1 Tax=Subtercola boreus TaxID=120213 RepID=A0A3E0W422_9MICO|nr:GntR family transcriptional regulator [Subtercola boreus]RFA16730.1 hypothetical protein B7R22_02420 [Subtercola boreus]
MPRYQAIEAWLTEQCTILPPGSLLPSEPELAARFNVSRMTARQAAQNMARRGLVERRQGTGTFVATPALHRRDGVLLSFTEDMRRRGMTTTSKVLNGEVTTSPQDAVSLGLHSTDRIVRLERVRFANGVPLAIELVSLPGKFAKVLEFDLENGSLHAALRELGRAISHSRGHVTARLASVAECRTLELSAPAPLLVESRTVYDDREHPIEHTETSYVAARWVIDTGIYAIDPPTS